MNNPKCVLTQISRNFAFSKACILPSSTKKCYMFLQNLFYLSALIITVTEALPCRNLEYLILELINNLFWERYPENIYFKSCSKLIKWPRLP